MRGKHDSQQTDEAELRASELAGNLKFSFASSWAFGGEDWTPLPMVGGELGALFGRTWENPCMKAPTEVVFSARAALALTAGGRGPSWDPATSGNVLA